ncbi:hypothetical protein V8C86DRAFT_3141736 [Haematococcus lacustris]
MERKVVKTQALQRKRQAQKRVAALKAEPDLYSSTATPTATPIASPTSTSTPSPTPYATATSTPTRPGLI